MFVVILQTAFLIAIAFTLGLIVGCLLRGRTGADGSEGNTVRTKDAEPVALADGAMDQSAAKKKR